MEGIDDLSVLNICDSIFDIIEMFHVIPEALIMLLLNSLQGFNSGGMLICALEVANQHGT
jgi:hypothetical protein